MIMNNMVKWLEDKGYENVTKKYISKEQFYKFTASKGCCTFSQAFEYPKTPDPILRHSKQLEFLQWFDEHFDEYCNPDPDRIRAYFNRNGFEVIDLDVTHAAIEITLCKGGNYYTARRMFIDELVSKFALVQRTVEEILIEFNRSVPWEPKIVIPTYDPIPMSMLDSIYGRVESDIDRFMADPAYIKYCENDAKIVREVINNMEKSFICTLRYIPEIKNVIFNPPATIVFWQDGTKTVVKANGDDEFCPEVGLAMAISKKALGNQGNYYNTFTKWTKKYYEEQSEKAMQTVCEILKNGCGEIGWKATIAADSLRKLSENCGQIEKITFEVDKPEIKNGRGYQN